MSLNGYRTAFVTGASSGIGAALCKRLAQHGVEVVLAARREDPLRALEEEIERSGGKARSCVLDVRDPRAVVETMQRLDDDMDGIDLVVANAGVGKSRWSGKLRWDDCAPTLEVNVIGATATLTALLTRMLSRKRGHLVGISSLAAYRGLPRNAAYSASKAFLSTFLESLRVDLGSTDIAVTDIRPGYVKTPMTEGNARMPLLMEVERAVDEIMKAIATRKGVHAFPLPLVLGLRSVARLPNVIYDPLARRMG